jgi:hypothetical protein
MKRYEALLREKGVDPNEVTGASEVEHHDRSASNPSEAPEEVWKLPSQATIFKPRLLQGQSGTELVDK